MDMTTEHDPFDVAPQLRATLDIGAETYVKRRIAEGSTPAHADAEVDLFCALLLQGIRAAAGTPGDRTADLEAVRVRFLLAGGTDAELGQLCDEIKAQFEATPPIFD